MTFTFPNKSKLLVALGLSASIFLSGCASTGSSFLGGPSADERLSSSSDAQFFSKSGLQACAAGAGVAILGCLVANPGNTTACMLIAGVAACGIGIGGDYYLEQRRAQYKNTNDRLQAITSDVQAETQRVIARTETVSAVIQDDKRQIAQIQQQIATKQIDEAKAKAELSQIDKNIEVLNKDLANMTERAELYEKVAQQERADGATNNNIRQLEQNIATMQSKIGALQKEVASLYDQRNAIQLG